MCFFFSFSFSIGIELDFMPVRRANVILKTFFLINKNGLVLKIVCFENLKSQIKNFYSLNLECRYFNNVSFFQKFTLN